MLTAVEHGGHRRRASERRNMRLVEVDGALKIDDISSLESHVDPDYAICVLTELATSEPSARDRALTLITTLRGVAEVSSPK